MTNRMKRKRLSMKWSERDSNFLEREVINGASFESLGRILNRTPAACESRYYFLLSQRHTPHKPADDPEKTERAWKIALNNRRFDEPGMVHKSTTRGNAPKYSQVERMSLTGSAAGMLVG